MILLDIKDYDIVNYKKPSMFLIFPSCTFKCGNECCQNYQLQFENKIDISIDKVINLYESNPLTQAIVLGGLEPFDTFDDLLNLIKEFRKVSPDDIVIYTGYYSYEILDKIKLLSQYNVIIKFGRYIPCQDPHYDELLGVNLASDNQFAARLLPDVDDIIDAIKFN